MNKTQAELRKAGKSARAAMSVEDRVIASQVINETVINASWFRRANNIGCYLATPDEVSTWEIISRAWAMKKRIFCPVLEKNWRMQFREIREESDLRPNYFGLLEPVDGEIVTARMLDIVITPLVAFDDDGHRIGMGGGYFDRTFSFLGHRQSWFHPKLVGVAFACQKVEKIPPNPWDIRVFCTISA